MRRHAELLGRAGSARERDGCTDFRKHVAWYLKGFPVGAELRRALAMVSSLSELDDLLGKLDPAEPFPVATLGAAARPDQRAGQGPPARRLAGHPRRRRRPRGRRARRLRRLTSSSWSVSRVPICQTNWFGRRPRACGTGPARDRQPGLTIRPLSTNVDTMGEATELAQVAAGVDAREGLRAVVALRKLADALETLQVANARRQGWSWQEIADALGVSKQAVHKKHREGQGF